MKKLLLPVFAVSALLLGSCTTSQLAQQHSSDDVYFTTAKAKEVDYSVRAQAPAEKSYRTDEQLYGGGNYTDERSYDNNRTYDDYNYDYGYASRLNRFYGNSPWRSSYYDSWYAYSYMPWYTYRYDPFYYDPWYYSPGTSVWIGIGTYPRYGYNNWGYYGSPYNSRYWGPYSYYNTYPGYGYGGGYYGGGYYGRSSRNNPNYRARPSRGGSESYGRGTTITGGQPRSSTYGGDGRVSSGNNSPEPSYRRSRPTGQESAPARERQPSTSSTRESQPSTRTERAAPAERSAPAPSSYGGGSSGGGGESRSRPSRGGN